MQDKHDINCTKRAAQDLLRWSMGSKPRYGHDFERHGYQEPGDLAKPRRAVGLARQAWWTLRYLALAAFAAILRFVLSFGNDHHNRPA